MERVGSYDEIARDLNDLLKRRVLVNALPDREALEAEIADGDLLTERLPGGLLLLRQAGDLLRVRFLLGEPASLCRWTPPLPAVLELPCRQGTDSFPALAAELEQAGWRCVLRRVRLTRKAAPGPDPILETAEPRVQDPEALSSLLGTCFSPLTGCLPSLAELEEDLREDRILVRAGGLLRWRRKGRVSEIRHLAVAPACRGRGLAKALLRDYLAREGSLLCRVWTGADNAAALGLYRGFGWAPDGWESLVLSCDKSTEINAAKEL